MVDCMPRRRRKRTDDVIIIDIANLDYYVECPIGRWWDNSWTIKKGDPGRPLIPITIGPHKLKAICDMGADMNVILC